MSDTLILDSRLLPVDVIPWARTMRHLALAEGKRHIRVLSEYPGRVVKCPGRDVQLPAVLQLLPGLQRDGSWTTRVVKLAKRVRFNRRNLFARDGGQCQYCGALVTLRTFSFDHVVPRAQGGLTRWENIVTACIPCNQRKGNRTPAQAGLRLRPPVRPDTSPVRPFPCFEEGMPEEWRPWLPAAPSRDARASRLYWDGRLKEEG